MVGVFHAAVMMMMGLLDGLVRAVVDRLDGWELREVRGARGELFVELDDCTCK
jgi:hypothetical protein